MPRRYTHRSRSSGPTTSSQRNTIALTAISAQVTTGVPRLGMVSRRGITATISDGFIVSPLLKCRQAVSEPDPAHAVTEPRMMGRRKCFGRVEAAGGDVHGTDRKSTRLNSSHVASSY